MFPLTEGRIGFQKLTEVNLAYPYFIRCKQSFFTGFDSLTDVFEMQKWMGVQSWPINFFNYRYHVGMIGGKTSVLVAN